MPFLSASAHCIWPWSTIITELKCRLNGKNYFNGKYSPLQLKLMGAGTHINGDIWRALTGDFLLIEIGQLTPFYKNYGRYIRKVYDELFEQGVSSGRRVHDLHLIACGLDKGYGK